MDVPVALGIDVTTISRVFDLVQRSPRFVQRIYTQTEQQNCGRRPERWASRWAAKEAIRKVLGSQGIEPLPRFRDIEISLANNGAPVAKIVNYPEFIPVSISHDRDLVTAVAIAPKLLSIKVSAQDIFLPARPSTANKGDFGNVLIVAGSASFSGAAYLTAMGAMRGGAGLVRLGIPQAIWPAVAAKCIEVMPLALPDDGRGIFQPEAIELLSRGFLTQANALVIGPGLGTNAASAEALIKLCQQASCPIVIDADGLNLLAKFGVNWREFSASIVITPHPLEMARLLGVDKEEVQQNRQAIANDFAKHHGVVTVLKGSHTVIAAPTGEIFVNPHEVVALATGGTGDVLSGLLGAMLAAGLEPFAAAKAAVTIHTIAGLMLQQKLGRAGALASDLLEKLPAAQEYLRLTLENHHG